jgi:hypothetical protein
VLDLFGQSVVLQPYLSAGGTPPVAMAGSWHPPCLSGDPNAAAWERAQVRNYVDVRRYEVAGRTAGWTVMRNPRTADVLAIGEWGISVPLSGRSVRLAAGGSALHVSESAYWLEWDQPAIARIQDRLSRTGWMTVPDVANQLGIAHRLTDPELLDVSFFRFDSSLAVDWTANAVGAPVDYLVRLPAGLAEFYVA